MPVRSRDDDVHEGRAPMPGEVSRGRRFGRLAPAPAAGKAVRCSCDRCGAHLMGVAGPEGRHRGICLVCGGESVTPV